MTDHATGRDTPAGRPRSRPALGEGRRRSTKRCRCAVAPARGGSARGPRAAPGVRMDWSFLPWFEPPPVPVMTVDLKEPPPPEPPPPPEKPKEKPKPKRPERLKQVPVEIPKPMPGEVPSRITLARPEPPPKPKSRSRLRPSPSPNPRSRHRRCRPCSRTSSRCARRASSTRPKRRPSTSRGT